MDFDGVAKGNLFFNIEKIDLNYAANFISSRP
jgi:hypothetical protein